MQYPTLNRMGRCGMNRRLQRSVKETIEIFGLSPLKKSLVLPNEADKRVEEKQKVVRVKENNNRVTVSVLCIIVMYCCL